MRPRRRPRRSLSSPQYGMYAHALFAARQALLAILFLLLLTSTGPAQAEHEDIRRSRLRGAARAAAADRLSYCEYGGDHGVGNIRLAAEGQGLFGWPSWTCWPAGQYQTGHEFPIYSGAVFGESYLWVGGVRSDDTLVSSLNHIPHWWLTEFRSEPEPAGCAIIRTSLPSLTRGDCGTIGQSDSAVSYEDIIVRYNDTAVYRWALGSDPVDGRAHKPLGISVTQRSFAWSTTYAEDFVIVQFEVRNVGLPGGIDRDTLRGVWFGLQSDVYAVNTFRRRQRLGRFRGLPPPGRHHRRDRRRRWTSTSPGLPTTTVIRPALDMIRFPSPVRSASLFCTSRCHAPR